MMERITFRRYGMLDDLDVCQARIPRHGVERGSDHYGTCRIVVMHFWIASG